MRLDGAVTKSEPAEGSDRPDRQQQILDAVLAVLARDGIAGVSVRAVAKEAGVASGLAGYYFDGKAGMVESALHRIGEQDVQLVAARPGTDPETAVRQALTRVASPRFLTTEYVTLPDAFTTNVCFAGDDHRTALITLSGSGRLVAMDWPRPGLALAYA